MYDALRARIEREGPIPARDALAACIEAYYSSGPEVGERGDFYTAANVSLFPRAVARFLKAAVDRLDGARVVELGGGTGVTAASLGLEVIAVEPHEGMATRQRERGLHVVASLDELKSAPTVFFANELLDALPVHRVLTDEMGELRELYVDARDGRLVEVSGPLSTEALREPAALLAPHMEDGAVVEICLDAKALLETMSRVAPRSIALFVDYGGEPAELFGPARPKGTLRGYHAHKPTDPYERPGEQDVTADVDFAFVSRLAERAGWRRAGYAKQGEWLADLGLLDDMMAALGRGDMNAYLAGKNLLMPSGMGERFKVLMLVKDVATEPPLPGFRPDIMPGAGRR